LRGWLSPGGTGGVASYIIYGWQEAQLYAIELEPGDVDVISKINTFYLCRLDSRLVSYHAEIMEPGAALRFAIGYAWHPIDKC